MLYVAAVRPRIFVRPHPPGRTDQNLCRRVGASSSNVPDPDHPVNFGWFVFSPELLAKVVAWGTASRQPMINRMRKGSYGSGTTSKPAKSVSTAFYEELFNKFKDSEERRPPAPCAAQLMLAHP